MSKNLLLILGILGIWFFVIRNTKSDKKEDTKASGTNSEKAENVELAMDKTYTL